MSYFPPPHPASWAARDPARFAAAARHAAEAETPWSRDLAQMVASDFAERPPWNETLGPVRPRGGPNGLILKGGEIVAEWGDTARADMTFSVAKSYLSILAGLAWDRGLIRDPHDRVRLSVEDGGFDPPHNDAITWHHLLQQTSEWEGTLWDKPDLIDRNRAVGGRPSTAPKGSHRDLQPPGGFWEYNDVRINRLALALLRVWRRPLPEVFRELVMEPIGASPDWEWHGYRNSWVEIGGERVQSVSGGGHWGGGAFISARDQARIGLSDAAPRRMERPPHPLRSLDRPDARALPALPAIRLSLVAQHRPAALSERVGDELLRPRRRWQPDLDRPRQRPRRRPALDRPRRHERLHAAGQRGVGMKAVNLRSTRPSLTAPRKIGAGVKPFTSIRGGER